MVQKQLIDYHGIQCGYCSPGMVMNMYSILESNDHKVTKSQVENSFSGNYCRCTGYRPIMDAFKSLAVDGIDIEEAEKAKMCSKHCQKKLEIDFEGGRKWHRVTEVAEVLEILNSLKDDEDYMLVAGNVSRERVKQHKIYVDMAAVKELRSYGISSKSVHIGANSTIAEAMKVFKLAQEGTDHFQYLLKIYDHFERFANSTVRNVTTIAGNLAVMNAKNFPSDIFVLFQSIDAKLEVAVSASDRITVTMAEFLKLDLTKKLITKVLLPPHDPKTTAFGSFKIMPRAQNTPAYVTAAFMIKFVDRKVTKANLCYGGITSGCIRAENTEKYLFGRNIEDEDTVAGAIKVLSDEIQPKDAFLAPSKDFRKNLAVALFYKFLLNIIPTEKISEKFKSGAKVIELELTNGMRSYEEFDKSVPVGNAVPKVEGDILATGEAKFANDLPKMADELYAAFVVAKKIHGVIKDIDVSEAMVGSIKNVPAE